MLKKFVFFLFTCTILAHAAQTQELKATISILSNRIGSGVDKKIFQTLQGAINDFLNNRRWSNENFQQQEKIACNFLLNLSSGSDNVYQASLTIQAARPVYNTAYQSPLLNFQDESVTFKYIQFQPLDFNENRVQGSEPLVSNLTAIFAYYVYMILGMNFDSFGLRGGDPYFQKAQNIVNNAPEGNNITGWKAFDGPRNRYWLAENLTNPKYTLVHDAFFDYYRLGLDQMYEKETDARSGILTTLNILNTVNTDNPNLMILAVFFQGKSVEFSNVFKKAAPEEKSRALDFLTRLDISNINRYKQDLQ